MFQVSALPCEASSLTPDLPQQKSRRLHRPPQKGHLPRRERHHLHGRHGVEVEADPRRETQDRGHRSAVRRSGPVKGQVWVCGGGFGGQSGDRGVSGFEFDVGRYRVHPGELWPAFSQAWSASLDAALRVPEIHEFASDRERSPMRRGRRVMRQSWCRGRDHRGSPSHIPLFRSDPPITVSPITAEGNATTPPRQSIFYTKCARPAPTSSTRSTWWWMAVSGLARMSSKPSHSARRQ